MNFIKDLMIDDVTEVVGALVESAIDSELAEGVLKEIPIISSLAAAYNVYNQVSNRIFLKKIAAFLYEQKGLDKKKLDEYYKLEGEKGAEKITDTVMLLLDKQERIEKCKWIGIFFRALVQGKIDKSDFDLSAAIISNSMPGDFELKKYTRGELKAASKGIPQRLEHYGLLVTPLVTMYSGGKDDLTCLSVFGAKFFGILKGNPYISPPSIFDFEPDLMDK